jgi:hypothetical protein
LNVITKRTVLLVVVLGALAAWLAAAATSGVRPVKPVTTPRPQIDLRGAALTAEIERLHDRLRPTTAPDHGRNLFQFARSRAAAAAPAPVNDVAPPAPAAPVEPPFKLIGIAEDNGTRTAILSSPSQLLMVHDGDNVVAGASTYRVSGISADAVELTPTADGSILRLALK